MANKERTDVLTLLEASEVLDLTPEAIRQRIKRGDIAARFDRGSPKLGYIIERDEFLRYLQKIGEESRAARMKGDNESRVS